MANANRRTTFVILASLDVPAPCRRQARAAAPAAYASTTCRGGVRSRRVQSQYTAEGASEVRVEDRIDERVQQAVYVAEPRDEQTKLSPLQYTNRKSCTISVVLGKCPASHFGTL